MAIFRRAASWWMAVVGVASVLACSSTAPRARVVAARAMTEVPLTMRGDYAVVPVSVAGAETPLLFILDTGAGGSVVSPATRAMLPIDPSESRFDTIVGAGGKSEMESVPLASLRVGEFTVEGLRAVVIDLADFKRSADEPYAGILGQDFLKRFDVEIDLPANRMRLHRRGNGNAPQLGFNAGPPLRNVSTSEDIGWLAFDATVEGKPVRALLDSGAPRTIVNWDAARAAGLSETSERVRKRERPTGGLGPARAPTFDFDATDLTVGSVAFGATPLRIANLQVFDLIGMGGKPGMLAGLDLLRRCAIFISYEDRTVRMCSRAEARATQ